MNGFLGTLVVIFMQIFWKCDQIVSSISIVWVREDKRIFIEYRDIFQKMKQNTNVYFVLFMT
jgi:hypothetical protein